MMLISSLVVLMVLTELKLQDSSRGYMHGSGKEGGRNGGFTVHTRRHSRLALRWRPRSTTHMDSDVSESEQRPPFCDSCLQKRRGKKLARRSRGSDRSRSIHAARHLSSPLVVGSSTNGERDKRIRIRRIIFKSNRRRLNGLVGTFAVGQYHGGNIGCMDRRVWPKRTWGTAYPVHIALKRLACFGRRDETRWTHAVRLLLLRRRHEVGE